MKSVPIVYSDSILCRFNIEISDNPVAVSGIFQLLIPVKFKNLTEKVQLEQ